MKKGQPSRTAEYMAFFRAMETNRPARKRLFQDNLARLFLSPSLRFAADVSTLAPIALVLRSYIDFRWPGARTSAIARTRFIDDVASESIQSGFTQVVILGAGFDSRAWRISGMSQIDVFEVDHPSTSARKQATLEAAGLSHGTRVRFVGLDFHSKSLGEAMQTAGFHDARPVLILWEGVTNYLTAHAVEETLSWCAQNAPGSRIAFTYINQEVLENPERYFGTEKIANILNTAEERWTFGLNPRDLAPYLAAHGLTLDSDSGASEYRARYYNVRRASRMRGYEFYRIAVAHVP